MVEASSMQKKMSEMQRNQDAVASLFGRLVSGRAGYKAVVEVSKPPLRCSKCSIVLEGVEKFCSECGTPTNFKK